MLTMLIYAILAVLIITTILVLVRTIVFQWSQRSVAPVVALGGNALLKRGEPMTHEVQRANIALGRPAGT